MFQLALIGEVTGGATGGYRMAMDIKMTGEVTNLNSKNANAVSSDDRTAGKIAITFAGKPWLNVLVALVGGLIGGALANRLTAPIPAVAADVPAKSIAAQEILLVDARGKPHASLHLNEDGMPAFQMFDLAGKNRIGIGFAKDGTAGLDIADQKGIERVLLSVTDDGVPALRLYDNTARPRLLFGVDSQGNSAIDFYDSDGKLLRELP